MSEQIVPAVTRAPTGAGADTLLPAVTGEPVTAGARAAKEALVRRDEVLAALDEGNLAAARDAVARGLAALEAAGPRGGADEAALLVARAEIEQRAGRTADARVTIVAAIALLGDAPPHDADTLPLWCQAQELLADTERLDGDFGAAAGRLRRMLDAALAAFGEGSPAAASAANALGVVHKEAREFGAGEAAYRRAVAAAAAEATAAGDPLIEAGPRSGAPGDRHPDFGRDLNALGALYHLAGRYGDADHVYRWALAVFEDAYGPDDVEVGMTCANLAVLDVDLGRFRVAEALGRRALQIFEAALGPEDAEVGLTLLNLGAAVGGQGRATEAAALTARAAAVLTARLPHDHPDVLAARELASALRSRSG